MCESLVGALSKVDREVIGAAMESVTWDGATRLGRGLAIFSNVRGPFETFGSRQPSPWATQSACI